MRNVRWEVYGEVAVGVWRNVNREVNRGVWRNVNREVNRGVNREVWSEVYDYIKIGVVR